MSAPYPVDPNKSAPYGSPAAGWGMPGGGAAPYPTQPTAPYPTQPTGNYPNQPPPPYVQPGFVSPPGPYGPQPPAPHTIVYYSKMGPMCNVKMQGRPIIPMHQPGPQPVYNASSGGFPIQPGPGSAGGAEAGLPKNDTDVLSNQFGASFSDKAVRHAFIRKVYLILMVQLLVTFCFVALFTFHEGVSYFVRTHTWIYMLSYGVFIVTYFSLICCSGVRRHWPGNFIMLGIFTLALSYMAGTIASTYETKIVVMTVGITAAICLCITLFATQTKYDFTGCGIYLFVASMVLFIFGIIAIVVYMSTGSSIMYTVYAAGIALLFSMYLVYDTQMIVGGRKHELSPEEHIYGALTLYMDIINIFLALLHIFGGRS